MIDLVMAFPSQLKRGLSLASEQKLRAPAGKQYETIFIAGMGGSGIGASILADLLRDTLSLPVFVGKDYSAPAWINEQTLCLVCSYSGDTEETLTCLDELLAKRASCILICSGGKLAAKAREKKLDLLTIPGGMPPRSCLGYSLVMQLHALTCYGILDSGYLVSVAGAAEYLEHTQSEIIAKSETLAQMISGKLPVLYSAGHLEAVIVRWRQQINENSKMLCWHHVIPEMNHNELVAWTSMQENITVLFFEDGSEHPQNKKRFAFVKEVTGHYASQVIEIRAEGPNPLTKLFYLIHLGDWLSCMIALHKQVDAMDISVISRLKNMLAE